MGLDTVTISNDLVTWLTRYNSLVQKVGDLLNLETAVDSNLVDAINSVSQAVTAVNLSLVEQFNSLSSDVDSNHTDILGVLSALATATLDLDSSVDSVEADVIELREDHDSDVDDLLDLIDSVHTEVLNLRADHDSDVDDLEVDIATNAAAITTNRSVGIGQTWANVLASRNANISYHNTTGHPIMVSLKLRAESGALNAQVSTNGVTWVTVGNMGGTQHEPVSFIVPVSHYYRVLGTITDDYPANDDFWSELR